MSIQIRSAVLALLVFAFAPPVVQAQITFTYDYTQPSGFDGSVANPTYYSADRRAAIQAAGTYLSSVLDGRGTVSIRLGTRNNSQLGSSTLAAAGPRFFIEDGFKINGAPFTQAMNNNSFISATDGHILVDFNSDKTSWFTGAGSPSGSGQIDMQSVALHELTHGLGFISLINRNNGLGTGASSQNPTGVYSQLDGHLRIGSAANATPFLTGGQGTTQFNFAGGATLAALTGNNVFFHGEFAKAANGGNAVQMAGGGDIGHLASAATNAVMLPAIGVSTDRRTYTNIDMAMLIDNGWNQFVWKNTTGNFADNVSSTNNARWQNLDTDNVLSPVGTVTTNSVLRFGGTGGYTATNNLTLAATTATGGDANRYLLTRMILNATAGTSTIAATGANVFRFDTTINVAPQIRQDGAGAFVISHPLELTNRNLQLTGDGTGRVTLSGTISQQTGQTTASITKSGNSTFTLTGNNTYSGGTTINGGELMVSNTTGSGSGTGSGAVVVNSGGTLSGTGRISGAVTVNAGGSIRGGTGLNNEGNLTLTVGNTTLNGATGTNGARLLVDLAQSTGEIGDSASKLAVGSNTFNIANVGSGGSRINIVLLNDGNLASISNPFTMIVATGSSSSFLRNGSLATGGNVYQITDFNLISGSGNWEYGNISLAISGNNLVLQFQPVPEPATVLAVGMAGLGVATWIRRRRQTKLSHQSVESPAV